MRLELYEEDLNPEYQDIRCSDVRFEHLSERTQKVVEVAGWAAFWERDFSLWYLILLPDGSESPQ